LVEIVKLSQVNRFLYLITAIVLVVTSHFAQSKPISAAEYDVAFRFAVTETNKAFPFIFSVDMEEYEKDNVVYSERMVNEREAEGVERITQTTIEYGKRSNLYQIKVGFGSVYCSEDGITWRGPQRSECGFPRRLYGRRDTVKSKYSVEDKVENGQKVLVYREYLTYKSLKFGQGGNFKETISVIDSRGFFTSVTNKEGTLDPNSVTLVRKQTWDTAKKFPSITAPK
jgi:hypothetical protein